MYVAGSIIAISLSQYILVYKASSIFFPLPLYSEVINQRVLPSFTLDLDICAYFLLSYFSNVLPNAIKPLVCDKASLIYHNEIIPT